MGSNLISRLSIETSGLPVHPIKINQTKNGSIVIATDIHTFCSHPYLNFDLEKTYKTTGTSITINNPQTIKKCIGLEVMSVTGVKPEN